MLCIPGDWSSFMFRRVAASLALVPWLVVAAPAYAQAAPGCQFILGFQTLHAMDPADIGNCTDNQAFAANGDAQQHTSNGLMAWRKADNWTAFTNGYWTWINGPNGLAKRLNTQRFSWEANPGGLPVADAAPAAPPPTLTSFDITDSTLGGNFHVVVFQIVKTGSLPAATYSKAVTAPTGTSFVAALLSVTNTGKSPSSFYSDTVVLRDGSGRTFSDSSTDFESQMDAEQEYGADGPGHEINPSLTDKIVIVYVVPGDASGLSLVAAPQ
jgi:hypothetical protein